MASSSDQIITLVSGNTVCVPGVPNPLIPEDVPLQITKDSGYPFFKQGQSPELTGELANPGALFVTCCDWHATDFLRRMVTKSGKTYTWHPNGRLASFAYTKVFKTENAWAQDGRMTKETWCTEPE